MYTISDSKVNQWSKTWRSCCFQYFWCINGKQISIINPITKLPRIQRSSSPQLNNKQSNTSGEKKEKKEKSPTTLCLIKLFQHKIMQMSLG